MTYQVGDVIPAAHVRGIVSGPEFAAPVWHGVIPPPQRDKACREFFRARDMYAFFPSERTVRHDRGKRIETERPIVSGIVYVQFRAQPQWDILKRMHRIITGVYKIGEVPVPIHRDVIRHLQGLTVEAERLREAMAEMRRIKPGDHARIATGALAGWGVDVREVFGQDAWVETLLGKRIKVAVSSLEKEC
jgi:transcription antitermination factor NusG